MGKLDLLPVPLRDQSISPREIVLPLSVALEAINFLEAAGAFILGWEGWVKTADGRHGHGTAPQGWSTDPKNLSVHDAAELCRNTIPADAAQWARDYPGTTDQLHICITVRA